MAAMTSTNYQIQWDSFSVGGDDTSSSASYGLRDTIGNTAAGSSSSSSFNLNAGYRQGVYDQVIDFEVFPQNTSSERAATALSGTTITADTTDLAEGDFIALVQDKGASQVAAIGKITSVGVGSFVVDELKNAGSAPTIDGTNDYVYELTGAAASLGTLSTSAVNTAIIGFNITADIPGGYVVQVYDDGNLRSGANDIDDVADGGVTVAAEEYGARSSDTSLTGSTFDTADTALATSFQDIADASDNTFERRDFLTLKAAISSSTADGSYGHTLTIITSGNY